MGNYGERERMVLHIGRKAIIQRKKKIIKKLAMKTGMKRQGGAKE